MMRVKFTLVSGRVTVFVGKTENRWLAGKYLKTWFWTARDGRVE